MIEVVASALIVGLISVGTLTGFGNAGRAVADERQRGQATLLAAQDEEGLRGMNVTKLATYGTKVHTFKEQGTNYTIESKAQFVSASEEKYTCETSGGKADYIQTTSTVTWPALTTAKGKREGVSQSSIVPVPTSDSLLVNVHNQANEPVEGATVKVTGKTSGAVTEQTTPASGCVIFGAMADSQVTIVVSKLGWINEKLEEQSSQEAQLSTTSLVSKTFVIASPGLINAEFVSAASGGAVLGDTYHVGHTSAPEKVIGAAGTYVSTLLSSKVFPYQTPLPPPENESVYTVYAGECGQTEPATLGTGLKDGKVQVNPGATAAVKIALPAINLVVNEGTIADGKAEAKLTDACGSVRTMKTTSSGALEHPYQPFGKTKLCLAQKKGT
ncbi:MAG TPA: hypothetical protein VFU90_16350, partial [Candidatus Tumulicola sp.]|nr:hypothetical protein [Candidatus Tumulicola sp.]